MSHPTTITTSPIQRLLRLPEVESITGLKKSSIYDLQNKGQFPQSIKLSRRAVCWPASAIDAWIAERIKASHTA